MGCWSILILLIMALNTKMIIVGWINNFSKHFFVLFLLLWRIPYCLIFIWSSFSEDDKIECLKRKKMFLIKVILHLVLFLLSSIGIHYIFDLNVYVTLLTLIHVYIASYYVSLWAVKFVFLFPCTKIKSDNKCVLITGKSRALHQRTKIPGTRTDFTHIRNYDHCVASSRSLKIQF